MSDYTPNSSQESSVKQETLTITASLEGLQTDQQRRILDTVSHLRKCGLDSILSLPQLVVCGDQSAGKSSVLEALTEISFPRKDNLCTRYATEIILRRAPTESVTIKIIPDSDRTLSEQADLKNVHYSISNFDDLPDVMDKASTAMGLSDGVTSDTNAPAFTKDVLSIEIEGPQRPQLTLVDIPGLVQTETKGVTKEDVRMVAEITEHYITQSRTICLAVVSASNDYANQKILTEVRKVDPKGERTLGIITKVDRLSAGSESEASFVELGQNMDINFKLGWHIVKNRSFEEGDLSFEERNQSEKNYLRGSAFNVLPGDDLGIDSLRKKLSLLQFEHVKKELPKLKQDLEDTLKETTKDIDKLGNRRTTFTECKDYLTQLSQDYHKVCAAAAGGHYEGPYFNSDSGRAFSTTEPERGTVRRVRAVIQYLNTKFTNTMHTKGHKYWFDMEDDDNDVDSDSEPDGVAENAMHPITMSRSEALAWVKQALARTRGRELLGSYNPLLIGELFWEQSSRWEKLAEEHINKVSQVCHDFLDVILSDTAPEDVRSRLWLHHIDDTLTMRDQRATQELSLLVRDLREYPINYNHSYTDTVTSRRQARLKITLKSQVKDATTDEYIHGRSVTDVDVDKLMESMKIGPETSMENFGGEDALDCLIAIYKVMQKTFIANVTTQVIERHIMRGIEDIFSPVVVNSFSQEQIEVIASEPAACQRQRAFLEEQITKLKHGQDVFRRAMGGSVV